MTRESRRPHRQPHERFVWWTNQVRILLVLGIPVFLSLNGTYMGVVPGAR